MRPIATAILVSRLIASTTTPIGFDFGGRVASRVNLLIVTRQPGLVESGPVVVASADGLVIGVGGVESSRALLPVA